MMSIVLERPFEGSDSLDCFTAAIFKGNAVALDPALSQQYTGFVVDSLLLAELAATKRYEWHERTPDWLAFRAQIAGALGWTVRQSHTVVPVVGRNSETVIDVAETAIGLLPTSPEAVVTLLRWMQDLRYGDPLLLRFQRLDGTLHHALLDAAYVYPSGEYIRLASVTVAFHSKDPIDVLLWHNVAVPDTGIRAVVQLQQIANEHLLRTADSVAKKLGDRRTTEILLVDVCQ